jgi:hypothetical protein
VIQERDLFLSIQKIERIRSKGKTIMGAFVFLGGLAAIGLAIIGRFLPRGLQASFLYSPLFWFGYVALLIAVTVVKFVHQQEALVIERLGRYNRTLTAGINIVWPAVERVA